MPNTIVAVRACAGGHTVSDANVLGMVKNEDASVSVYCTDHAAAFDAATHRVVSQLSPVLEM